MKTSFMSLYRRQTLILLIVAIVITASLNILYDIASYCKKSRQLPEKILQTKKAEVKYQTDRAIEFINFQREVERQKLIDKLHEKVEQAWNLANSLYEKNKNKLSDKDLKKLVHNNLSALNWDNGEGYYFAIQLDGTLCLQALRPELEGVNLIDKNYAFATEMVKIATEKDKGYVQYDWYESSTSKAQKPKISYIKLFEPFDWLIGTGEYLEKTQQKIKKNILNRLAEIRYNNGNGYLFIVKYDRTCLASATVPGYVGKKLTSLEFDKVIALLYKSSQKPDGDFCQYKWKHPSSGKSLSKISFARSIDDWQWIIGTGLYLDDIETIIAAAKTKLKHTILMRWGLTLAVAAILILITIKINSLVVSKAVKEFKTFNNFLSKAENQGQYINQNVFRFREFEEQAQAFNKMVVHIHEANEKIELFKTAVETTTNGITICDINAIPFYQNKAFVDLFGYNIETLKKSTDCRKLYSDSKIFDQLLAKIRKKESFSCETKMITSNNKKIDILLKTTPVKNKDNEVTAMMQIYIDVTELKGTADKLKKTHSQLLDASKHVEMSELATGVLHNVGNLLNSINITTGMVRTNIKDLKTEDLQKVVNLLKEHEADLSDFLANSKTGEQIITFLSALSDYFDEEKKKMAEQIEDLSGNVNSIMKIISVQQSCAKSSGATAELLNIKDFLEKALHIEAISLKNRKIEVIREYDDMPPIIADQYRIIQIVTNLIGNAKHALDDSKQEHKCIKIQTVKEEKTFQIIISDNGVGISSENLEKIFTYGFTTKKHGHGFGLNSSAKNTKEMNGTLTVSSEGVDRGATFTLTLPMILNSVNQEKAAEDLETAS